MRSGTISVLISLALWLLSGPLVAQSASTFSQDFSGLWAMAMTRSEAAAQEQPGSDVIVTITQSPTILKIETVRSGTKDIAVYPIEKQPSETAEVDGKRRAYWDRSVLIDEGSVDINGQTIAFREARTSSAGGAEMIVETTLKIEHGYELKGAQTIVTGKKIYVRSR